MAAGGDPASVVRPFDRDRTAWCPAKAPGPSWSKSFPRPGPRGAIYGEVVAVATSAVADRRLVADCRRAMENVLGWCCGPPCAG